nr:MAG TPA: hypothetical protein [Caudoviricetes sp.]DAU58425.1 MAG TPA: hypothetical protein [Caudoviricetes sp.]
MFLLTVFFSFSVVNPFTRPPSPHPIKLPAVPPTQFATTSQRKI